MRLVPKGVASRDRIGVTAFQVEDDEVRLVSPGKRQALLGSGSFQDGHASLLQHGPQHVAAVRRAIDDQDP
jgi:hypothetical protein